MRLALRQLCLTTLLNQTYTNWRALLIGQQHPDDPVTNQFVFLPFEGHKEEKMQKAVEHILACNMPGDYLIRLDDDDIINPRVLAQLKSKTFDLFVEKYQSFVHVESGRIAQKVMYWFPNTCIHKRVHALAAFGALPPGNYQRYSSSPVLIENEHNDFHHYYHHRHHIIYARKKEPLYLRCISASSITALQSGSTLAYLNQYGYFKKRSIAAFSFLAGPLAALKQPVTPKQTLLQRVAFALANLRALKNYYKVVVFKP